MGRTKSTPVKLGNLPGGFLHQKPQSKRARRKSAVKNSYAVFPPDESNEQYYLGDVWLGTSNNAIPEPWKKCKVHLTTDQDAATIHMEFNSSALVLVDVTNDLAFVKGLFSCKLFAMNFQNNDGQFIAQLFISKLPLPTFNKIVGNTIKVSFASIFNIQVEVTDTSIAQEDNMSQTKELVGLYKNIQNVRRETVAISEKCVQHPFLKPKLRPYQEHAVQWMIMREQQPKQAEMLHPLYQMITLKTGATVYFNKHTGFVDNVKPVVSDFKTGGILADEMGLGKTVEVLALILSHPKPDDVPVKSRIKIIDDESCNEGSDADVNNCISEESPVVLTQPRKIKRKSEPNSSKDDYVDEPKKLKISNGWVKGSSKKSETRIALEMWYNSMLQGVSLKSDRSSTDSRIQCICGSTDEEDAVRCLDCFKYQHASCLGYKRNAGKYRCPRCWMEQPHLESKATLIVCPSSLRNQWSDEVCKHVGTNLKVLVYEGSKAAPIYPTNLKQYDLVLTTYNVLQSELRLTESGQSLNLRREPRYSAPGSPFARIKWWRLCLDEAQAVEVSSCMISTMAKKLQAHHRWAITGTPISRDISDLYGLIDYLQLSPFNEFETWHYLLYKPYMAGNMEPMLNFLAQVMWRTSKNNVLEQIGIPTQTIKEYTLNFSAVEKYYYTREHELCATDFLEKLKKYDITTPLRKLDRSSVKKIMAPLRSIRNACTHPNATRGRYLGTRKKVTTMQGLLEALIEKNLSDSEENLRLVVSALNGLAGIHLLLQNSTQAVEEYRQVLQLAARFNCEDSKKGLCVDKLQLIHTMHNLAEVLETSPPVHPTLRDHTLRQDCLKLQKKYMEKYINQNIAAYEESQAAINLVNNLQKKSTFSQGQWYSMLVDWVVTKDLFIELQTRIFTLLENANNKKLSFTNERRLLYLVSTWDEEIMVYRSKTIKHLSKVYSYSKEDKTFIINEGLVEAAVDCHLRPQKNSKKNFCLSCKISVHMRQYEAKLFDMAKSKGDDEEDISNKGSWKPTSEELALKGLLNVAKSKNADKECIHNGEVFFNVLEAMKKEFKQLRKFWTYLDQQICAHDEINICKTRLSLKDPSEEHSRKQSGTDRILKHLSYVLENKLQCINLLEEHEIMYQVSVLRTDESQNMAALERNLGTHSYLQTLSRQQYAGENPDPCPICKNALSEHWSILQCGHCYCLECIQLLLEKTHANCVSCSVCRRSQKIEDISYIRKGDELDNPDGIEIKGNYSTKIEAVVRLVIKLKNEEPDVKILVFSAWTAVLKILQRALEINDISAEDVQNTQGLQKSLSIFKNKNIDTTVLLLPIALGAKGLNLIEATHVVLVEPLLNPDDELQAIGRVHRIGQTRPTTVHKFLVKNTIEESIHHATSSNADIWDKNTLTLQQLRNLFIDSLEEQPIIEIPHEVTEQSQM